MKAGLHRYLQNARRVLLWKLDGLSEYDVRRPLVPSGTNLLGLVKHLAGVEAEYFGSCFGRPFPESLPWMAEGGPSNADMWATADESREWIIDLYRRVIAHADATIEALPLDAVGHVPWWPADGADAPLHRLLLHMVAETNRHAGQADIVRELIDGQVGMQPGNSNLPPEDAAWWDSYRADLQQVAEKFRQR